MRVVRNDQEADAGERAKNGADFGFPPADQVREYGRRADIPERAP